MIRNPVLLGAAFENEYEKSDLVHLDAGMFHLPRAISWPKLKEPTFG
jgi:hypothetical protein